jgi:integrase
LRQGELLALQWGDIDHHRGVIKVRRAFSRGKLQTPKTSHSMREVRVGKNLLRALHEHQLRTGARSEFVFTTRTGAPLDPANLVKRGFEPTLRSAGLRKIRFHDLRHTYASIMINEGANLKFVSKQLGHSSIQITLDRYSHLIPERHDAAVEQFEALLIADSSASPATTSGA